MVDRATHLWKAVSVTMTPVCLTNGNLKFLSYKRTGDKFVPPLLCGVQSVSETKMFSHSIIICKINLFGYFDEVVCFGDDDTKITVPSLENSLQIPRFD